jgi:hypothetical protein
MGTGIFDFALLIKQARDPPTELRDVGFTAAVSSRAPHLALANDLFIGQVPVATVPIFRVPFGTVHDVPIPIDDDDGPEREP